MRSIILVSFSLHLARLLLPRVTTFASPVPEPIAYYEARPKTNSLIYV